MRFTTITIALAALLVSGAAGAAGGGEKDPGKGASGPPAAAEGPSGGNAASGDQRDRSDNGNQTPEKAWEVGAGLEYHHLMGPGYVNAGSNRNIDYISLGGRYDITPNDRVSVSWGLYQTFLTDAGESPVALDDILFTYTRRIQLPADVTLRPSVGLTAPTSKGSQLAGVYTTPRIGLAADKKFGKYFTLDARLRGTFYIVKATSGGGQFADAGLSGFVDGNAMSPGAANPNPRGSFAMSLGADLSMPFHEPLSIGAALYTSYTWYYNVGNSGMLPGSADCGHSAFGTPSGQCMNVQTVAQPGQPTQQFYGYTVDVKYEFPDLKGFKSDLSFTFAPLGDGTLGWTPVIHDGSQVIVPYYRQTAEFFFSLNLRY